MRLKIYPIFIHAVVIALAAVTLTQRHQNQKLTRRLYPERPRLEIGSSVGEVEITQLEGLARTLRWDDLDRDRLLLVFTTSCPACKQNQEAWRSIYQQLAPNVEVIGISLNTIEATRTYSETHNLPFEVVVATDPRTFTTNYKVPTVPTTLHIDRGGRVRGAWRGVLNLARQAEVENSTLHQVTSF